MMMSVTRDKRLIRKMRENSANSEDSSIDKEIVAKLSLTRRVCVDCRMNSQQLADVVE